MSGDHKSGKKYRRMKDRGRVHPDLSQDNSAYEMDSVDEEKTNNRFQAITKRSLDKANALNIIVNLKSGASKWRRYATGRRKRASVQDGVDRKKTGGLGLEYEPNSSKAEDLVDSKSMSNTQRQIVVAHNRNLIEYFAKLGSSQDEDDCVNLEYVESLLKAGANIDCTDKYGQTIFHEVARTWHVDVAKFLVEHKAYINQGDNFGRTPLHVAAAVDYPEMVEFLIQNGADKEARTTGDEIPENQTPVHFAARNDACSSLKQLIKDGCEYKDVRDYKGRTPLHLAAELDRSESAAMLLELDDPAPAGVTDNSCQAAIVWMITKMPSVAKIALDQFHTTDRANRKQYYHLHHLEPRKPDDDREVFPQSALRVLEKYHHFDLILHPAIRQLIRVHWGKYAKRAALLSTLINLLFIVLWSVLGIVVEYDRRYYYDLPNEWWRIFLFILAIGATIYQLTEELSEFFHSRKQHSNWKQWREKEIDRDVKYAHPRWPDEELYLEQEQSNLDKMRPQYFNDFWNIYDWICYAFLLVVVITHLVDIFHHTHFIARLHIRINAVTIILLWFRLMKNARAFSLLGPFIVMIGHMLSDLLKFLFLYVEFYIPYGVYDVWQIKNKIIYAACAFWMLFGENKVPEEYQGLPDAGNYTITVNGFGTVDALLFSLFRLTLVDDYDYDGMKQVDSIMADILVGTWLAISAVLMINLLIALLSDTFQRVYDNAKANAVMQKAIFILNHEESMKKSRKKKFRKFIHEHCAPESAFYDDDTADSGSDDLKKVTFQIKDQLDELREILDAKSQATHDDDYEDDDLNELKEHLKSESHKANNLDKDSGDEGDDDNQQPPGGAGGVSKSGLKKLVSNTKLEQEVDILREDIQSVRDSQEKYMGRLKRELGLMRGLLEQIAAQQGTALAPAYMDSGQPISGFPPLGRTWSGISAGQIPDLQQRPVTAPRDTFANLSYQQTPLNVSTLSRTGSLPPSRGTLLTTTAEEDWAQSEERRKQDLEDLRRRLAEQASSHTAASRSAITPFNTVDPNGAPSALSPPLSVADITPSTTSDNNPSGSQQSQSGTS